MDHEEQCARLYAEGNGANPVPDGLLVLGAGNCMLCKNSMRNNGYPTKTANGTPITWLNIDEEAALNRFYAIPGITYLDEMPHAAGEALGGVPFVLLVEGGAVKRGALRFGEVPAGGFEQLLEQVR